ncbi:pirin family protein [Psychrobacter sp. UBA3962]|uniref:pirin family protein n=1 Tax=Psychrobacter sp. UBA3962 TaxID=1947352 RepID=UPI0025D1EE11|nr:pirin family protein [Psychrobacter sp. UBA3962]
MKTIVHKANTRGNADHGWLKSKHTFSFANYYNPERMGFGALRVINDDHVEGGMGFGTHPHRDMEIISIPTAGKLAHKDTIGTNGIIESGEIQVMSAGTGIAHSEMNGNADVPVKFFQIWVMPNKQGVEPRYQQLKIADMLKPNEFGQILSPNPDDAGVWIHQDAWFHMGNLDKGVSASYELKGNQHGVYAFVIEGKVKVGDEVLDTRDGMGIIDTKGFEVEALEDSRVLLMEVPM